MKILFETLERDRYEVQDPCINVAAEAALVAHAATCYDTTRILAFDPDTLAISDVTDRYYDAYDGTYDEDAPLWIKERPDFESLAAEQRSEIRKHYGSRLVA